jgi:CRP/FNR family cyclic AMP-dependent transcriptional regulator
VTTAVPVDPFAPLRQETLRAIAESGVIRQFPKQTVLIHEGDVGDALYIILAGRVKVYASNAAGREVVIDFHGPGECLGEMSLDGAPRSASVITVEPTTCAIVNRAHFRDFVLAHPEFALYLIEKLIHRVRVTTENVKSLALSDVYGRLVRLLNTLATPVDGHLVVHERMTQQEIADRVGASRDMIGKLMKDLVAGGYLAVEDRTITILKKLPTGW